jgi:spore maturation protein SpmB
LLPTSSAAEVRLTFFQSSGVVSAVIYWAPVTRLTGLLNDIEGVMTKAILAFSAAFALVTYLVNPSLLVTFQDKVLAAVGSITSSIQGTQKGVDRKWEGLNRNLGK